MMSRMIRRIISWSEKKEIEKWQETGVINHCRRGGGGSHLSAAKTKSQKQLSFVKSPPLTDKIINLQHGIFLLGFNEIFEGSTIGSYSYLGRYTKIDSKTSIGSYCSIADHVLIGASQHPTNWLSTSPFQYDQWISPESPKLNFKIRKETTIGHDVWIGTNVVIKSGIKIGTGAIIGAGAIVCHDVPPYAIVVGVPAKILRYRFSNDVIKELLESEWWNLDRESADNFHLKFNKSHEDN